MNVRLLSLNKKEKTLIGELKGKVDLLHEDMLEVQRDTKDMLKHLLQSNGELGKLKLILENHLSFHEEENKRFSRNLKIMLGIASIIATTVSLAIAVVV